MKKDNIYKCSHEVSNELPKIVEKSNLDYNLANRNGLKMGELAEKIHNELKSKMATLPFCHTIEAQAFGSEIEMDLINGNKIVSYPISNLKDTHMISIPSYRNEKIQMVLEAIEYLRDKNIPTVVNVIGPVTLASCILPAEEVYRGISKDNEDAKKLFSIIEDFLAEYISRIIDLNIDVLSYADPSGTMDIVGSKLYKKIAGPSFLRVLEKADINKDTLIHLCPKTSTSLLAVDMIEEDKSGILSGGCCISKGLDHSKNKRYRMK